MFVPSVDINAAPSPRCFSRAGGEDFCPLRANDHDAWRVHRASREFTFEGFWGVAAYVGSSSYGELIKRVKEYRYSRRCRFVLRWIYAVQVRTAATGFQWFSDPSAAAPTGR